jgi:hypothetical protein
MKVELESPLKKALLKGCLWMGENEGSPEGGQDEASQQHALSQRRCSTAKAYDKEESSRVYYL